MLKILQASLQQYVNCELPDVQAGFRKGTGTRDQIANIRWIIKKASSLQFSCLVMSDSLWPHGLQHARPPRPSPTPRVYSNSMSLLMPIESLMPSNPLILCLPLLILPSIFPNIRVFSNESILCIRWYSGFISFRIDGFDFLGVQGTLKSLLQHHSLKAIVLQHSVFFMVQLSHPYMTIGKTTALTKWIFVSKVISLFF